MVRFPSSRGGGVTAGADLGGRGAQAECEAGRVDLAWRDNCSKLLLPLNECRRKHLWWPWSCGHEKHAYEACQYHDYVARVKELKRQDAVASGSRTLLDLE